ncbi:probable folate-biopterin transporter 8, chloroplastic [Olea europaea subsp. europaea]|uniref:Probable folate-biopterin transporter 8, chloroplastic n=1 Tax=Olea europaea subsp. europaea TaxID=158383 RepID=A0A8S0TWG3_OLEEU|nr:probable folate-biopterin transporter 8, chloroplastic [Olea europaea subsp. europaea]
MISSLFSSTMPLFPINVRSQNQSLCPLKSSILRSQQQNLNPKNIINNCRRPKFQLINPVISIPSHERLNQSKDKPKKDQNNEFFKAINQQLMVLCGFGYYVNGFRCFPWLALNYHMAHNLNMQPSTLQLVQNSGNLPMVAKPLYGILSDALYIGGAHRIPYVSIGAFLQILSWGSLALIPVVSEALPALMACVLVTNLGASISEVAKDALVAEYGQKKKMPGLQSYAFMASALGGVLGNLLGGFFLLKTQQTKSMFLAFAALLALQLTISLNTREKSLGLTQPSNRSLARESISQSIMKSCSDLMMAVKEERILRPLIWVVSSIVMIPILSGSIFCYQTQCLNLDPSIIGMSRVTGQLMLLSLTLLYNRLGKSIPLRKLIGIVQLIYASSLLLDLVLVKQINVQLGIPNEVFALCFSGLAETIAQFKLLPFLVFFADLAPPGCEGSLMSFLASALCLSSIISGFFGVGLASLLGITYGDYSSLPRGIMIQFFAALLPLCWIGYVPMSHPAAEKARKRGRSKRSRRNRRIGKVVFDSIYSYRRKRESDLKM